MHQHDHGSSNRIGWAFLLNFCFTIIEFIGGWFTNSTAIMADAVHDLGDTLSIGLAWMLNRLSGKDGDNSFTYGYRRFSLLGALINGVVLVIGSLWIFTEAIPRLENPEMPNAQGMLWLAFLGVGVNGYAAYKLSQGETLNERVLNWHLLEDVLGWVAVLIVALVLLFFDLPILDPILSIGFTLFILFNVTKNIIATLRLFLQAAPDKEMYNKILSELLDVNKVTEVHHLHLWSLDGERNVLTAHLVLDHDVDQKSQIDIKSEIANRLSRYRLEHTTIEFELPNESCRDENHTKKHANIRKE